MARLLRFRGMKKIKFLLYISVFFVWNSIYAQDYTRIDELVKSYPASFANSEKLAVKINQDFITEEDKARAIFVWIALNVRYDLAAFNAQRSNRAVAYSFKSEEEKILKELQFRKELAEKTLHSKKGVCQGYATLFLELCNLTGIKCITIPGTSKTNMTHIGKLPTMSDHMWNAIKIDGNWKLVDPTWAAGSVDGKTGKFITRFNDGYFCTDPELFYLNHFPDDERLLMIQKTKEDFAALPLYYGGYLQAEYEIISPENGIFSNTKSNVIPFKIVDMAPTDKVAYVFSSNGKFVEIPVRRNGNLTEFEIIMDNKSRGYLTLFINNRSIVSYKIDR